MSVLILDFGGGLPNPSCSGVESRSWHPSSRSRHSPHLDPSALARSPTEEEPKRPLQAGGQAGSCCRDLGWWLHQPERDKAIGFSRLSYPVCEMGMTIVPAP